MRYSVAALLTSLPGAAKKGTQHWLCSLFCIAAADENCKFGDVGMRGARARGALRRRRKPCQGAAGNRTLRASTVTRSRRFLIQRRTMRYSVAALLAYDNELIRKLLQCVVVESSEQIRVIFVGGIESGQKINS